MDTRDTLQAELDRSFGDGPPLPPAGRYVVAGRRALLRRRVASTVAGLVGAAVLVATWHAVSTGSSLGSDRLVAGPPSAGPHTGDATAAPATDPTDATDHTAAPWPRGELVRYTDGELQVRPGVVVHEQIRNPYDVKVPAHSDALDVTWRGHRQWLIIVERPSPRGTSSSASTPSTGWASFADYVADQVRADRGAGAGADRPAAFLLDDQGRVVPAAGTHVFNRTDDPQLGPDFAPPGATTGAAVVSVVGEEGDSFVVWRVVDGELDVITAPPGDTVGATFDELLSGARVRYASGGGLR